MQEKKKIATKIETKQRLTISTRVEKEEENCNKSWNRKCRKERKTKRKKENKNKMQHKGKLKQNSN